MTDSDDVRQRLEASLKEAAARAYEAAHGVVADEPREPGPARWRWLLSGRLLASTAVMLAAIGVVVWWVPVGLGGANAAVERVPGPTEAAAPPAAADTHVGTSATAVPAGEVMVHVAGLVNSPGVYSLPTGARVADAIAAAGGAAPGANPDAINLARPVVDGERIEVPAEGAAPAATVPGGLINVNTAPASELEGLPGVGPVLAERIVSYRERNGPFAAVGDLDAVSGIGPTLLAGIEAEATV